MNIIDTPDKSYHRYGFVWTILQPVQSFEKFFSSMCWCETTIGPKGYQWDTHEYQDYFMFKNLEDAQIFLMTWGN